MWTSVFYTVEDFTHGDGMIIIYGLVRGFGKIWLDIEVAGS